MNIEEIYEKLVEKDFISYGKLIPKEVIESLIGIKFRHGDWEFMGKYLQLKEYIEDQGFFCTCRKCGPGNLRILYPNEWAHKLENVQKTVLRKQKRAINTSQNIDMGDLSDREKLILNHMQNKLTMGLQAMSNVLYNI